MASGAAHCGSSWSPPTPLQRWLFRWLCIIWAAAAMLLTKHFTSVTRQLIALFGA
jgi:hypothetical protein